MTDINRTTPKESGSITIRGHEVVFLKCQERSMGKIKYFWRADYNGETIATKCRTKAECVKEARQHFRTKAGKKND